MNIDETKYKNITRNLEKEEFDYTILRFKNISYCNKIKKRLKLKGIWSYVSSDNNNHAKIMIDSKEYHLLRLSNRENRNLINQYSVLT